VDDAALFGHLLGAFLFVSGTVVAGVAFEAGRRRTTPREIALLLGLARIGAALVGVGMLAVLAFGLWLVHLGGWGYGAGWVDAAIALFVVAVALGGYGGQAPKRARQLATRLAAEGQPVNDDLRSLLADRPALVANYASALLMVAILVLMVWKPGAAPEAAGLGLPIVANVVRSPLDVPPPITRHTPRRVHVHLVAKEVSAELAPGVRFPFWTYALAGQAAAVPGPMIRALAGDTIVLQLTNDSADHEPHGVDFHAAIGPGGGTDMVEVAPGETKTFTFTVHRPGAFVYHCGAEGKPWEHVSHGMFGLIEVDPPGGLPPGYRELYVGQSEWYVDPSTHDLDEVRAEAATPDYVTFNGSARPLAVHTRPGRKVRIFFVNGGPNLSSSFHVIGEIFDRVYPDGRGDALRNEETAAVPPGSAAVFELTAGSPGMYPFVDHALWHAALGAEGLLTVTDQG
jgi:nitrite reductase (NO-forming)